MKTINVDLSSGEALNLLVGRQGESGVTQVIFDFSSLNTEFGAGVLSLSVKRPKEYTPYAQTITTSGTDATWLVNETDTGVAGCGEIQLTYTVNSQIAKTVVFKYTVYPSIGVDGEYPIPGQTWQEEIEEDIAEIKEDLDELKNDAGVTADLKLALLDIAENIAYINENGQTLYNNLYNALYPNAESISCVYTQTGTVYTTDTLNSLKSNLVVTAYYSDSTTRTLAPSDYTLTGTLTAGTSTVTVHYGDLTATFSVTVTARVITSIDAAYTQSGTVYDIDSLDSLKSDLVVTANWSDSSQSTISSSDYTLSGSLNSSTSTITVTYEDKTDTFTVAVTVTTLWQASNKSYNKTDPCDDTGLQPMLTDQDFTILMDATQESAIAKGAAVRLLFCATEASGWKGIFFGVGTNDTYLGIQWMNDQYLFGNTYSRLNTNQHFKLAYRHVAGSDKVDVFFKLNNNAVLTDTMDSAYISNDRHLTVGGADTTAPGSNWVGTMNSCKFHNIALSDAYINSFIG